MNRSKLFFMISLSVLAIIIVLLSVKIKEKIAPNVCHETGHLRNTMEVLLPIACSNKGIFEKVTYGYANLQGDIILMDSKWVKTAPFNDLNFAIVTNKHEKDAIINKKGKIILDYEYEKIHYLGENMYSLQKINEDGTIHYYLGEYVNSKIQVKEITYPFIYNFHEGIAAIISQKNKIGYINKKGDLVIPAVYDKNPKIDHRFLNGKAVVILNGVYGVINQKREVVVPFIYQYIEPASLDQEFLKFQKNNKWGLMDSNYMEIIEASFSYIGEASEGVVIVSQDLENYAFFDLKKDEFITSYLYKKVNLPTFIDHYNYFQYGYAVVTTNGERFNLINKKGESVFQHNYLGIKLLNADYAIVQDAELMYELINLNTKEVEQTFEGEDLLIYKGHQIIALSQEKNEDGASLYKLYHFNHEEIVEGLLVYDYMKELTIEGESFLYFQGELNGYLFSSYFNFENDLLWKPC